MYNVYQGCVYHTERVDEGDIKSSLVHPCMTASDTGIILVHNNKGFFWIFPDGEASHVVRAYANVFRVSFAIRNPIVQGENLLQTANKFFKKKNKRQKREKNKIPSMRICKTKIKC